MEGFKKGRSILLIIFGIVYFIFWCIALITEWWYGFVETEGEFIFYSLALFFLFVIATGVNVIINVLIEIGNRKITESVLQEETKKKEFSITDINRTQEKTKVEQPKKDSNFYAFNPIVKKKCENCGHLLIEGKKGCPNCGWD